MRRWGLIASVVGLAMGSSTAAFGAAGELDPTFNGGQVLEMAEPNVTTAPLLTDAFSRIYLATTRRSPSGVFDTGFGTNGYIQTGAVTGLDGAGRLHGTDGTQAWRYTSDGTLDSAYGTGGTAGFGAVPPDSGVGGHTVATAGAIGSDGAAYAVVVQSTTLQPTAKLYVRRIDPNGNADPSYGSDLPLSVTNSWESAKGEINHAYRTFAAVDAQGRLIVGRTVPDPGTGNKRAEIRRFTTTGAVDTTWGSSGVRVIGLPASTSDAELSSMEITPEGEVLGALVGSLDHLGNPVNQPNIVGKLDGNGNIDSTFLATVPGTVTFYVLDATEVDGKVITADIPYDDPTHLQLRRFDATGQPDPTFVTTPLPLAHHNFQSLAALASSAGRVLLSGTGIDSGGPGGTSTFHPWLLAALTRDPTLAPVSNAAPHLRGTPSPGNQLTCDAGTWSGATNVDVLWDRAPRSVTSDNDPGWSQLPVTGRTYTPVDADLGSRLRCREHATNVDGATDAPSNSLRVDPGPPVSTAPPTLSGTPVIGQTLRCDPGAWTNSPDFTARWLRDGDAIPGVTALLYTLTSADRRHRITCEVTARNDIGEAGPVRATNDLLAVGAPPAILAYPTIDLATTGPKPTDLRLTCGTGRWDEDYGQYDYRWEREGAEIAGATGATYDATVDDLGREIRCRAFSTNPAGRSDGAESRQVLVPLPATGEPGAIYTGGGYNHYDPLNLMAVTKAWLDRITALTVARRQAAVDATRSACASGPDAHAPLPDFASLTAGRVRVSLGSSNVCGVLLHAPPDQLAYPTRSGIYWTGTGGCYVSSSTEGGNPCPSLRITVPRLNAATPPESISALEQSALDAVKPVRVLWDFNNDGRTDATCGAEAPILRTLPSRGNYDIRAVVISADSQQTGLYSVTDLHLPFFAQSDAQRGYLRQAQPFACKTTLIPPEEASQPCISEATIGRVHIAGDICPISARSIPESEIGGLPSEVQDMLQAQALNGPLRAAPATRTLPTDISMGLPAAPGSTRFTTTRQVDALSSIGSAPPAAISARWADNLKSVPGFDAARGQFALDQIYAVRGNAKLNGIDVQPRDGALTMLVPSDAGQALQGIKQMTISSRSAAMALGGVPIGGAEKLSQDLPDSPQAALPPVLRAANLDDLTGALTKKLDLGPFKVAGDAKLRMQSDGTALIDAQAQLKGPFTAGGGPIRTAVTIHADGDGRLALQGVHLAVPRAALGGVTVSGLNLDYDGGGLSIKGQLLFPPVYQGISINRFRTTAQGEFQELDVDYLAGAGQGINIGPGIFLVKLGGGLSLNPEEIRGRASVSFGPSPGGGCPTAGVDADLNVHFGPPPFFVDANSTVELVCIPLGNAHFHADTTGLADVSAQVHLDIGPVYVDAGLHGRLQLPDWQVDLHGTGGIRHILSGTVKALISNYGLAACGRVRINLLITHVTIAGGAGIRFSNGRPPFTFAEMAPNMRIFEGCDLSSWSPFHRDVRAAQAGGAQTFTLGKDAPRVLALELTGAGGAPRVQIVNPKGQMLDASHLGEDLGGPAGVAGLVDPPASRTVVFVDGMPGTWTVKPVDGSPAVTAVEHAAILPQPQVTASVGGTGAKRVLRYHVARIPGQVVRFVEQSRKGQRAIKTVTGGGDGTARFITSEGPGTARQIIAMVTQDRLPRTNLTVARFSAPAPLPARPRVSVRRRGAVATLRWARDPFARRYELTVATGRGRRYVIDPPGRATQARVSGLAAGEGARVRIVAITPAGYHGPARVVRVVGTMRASSAPKVTRWDRRHRVTRRARRG